ncbi:MAG: YmdB family metallophosphoesterase [Candidatus Riflebacteria bacterium]|nr:YmdB family metallophosphoesterase [Candidatus Riflebacteria bacterium]
MLAIAFIGVIQHEVAQAQLRRLLTTVKDEAGAGCVTLCNAGGLFSSAPSLESQVGMLFDSGIDVVFSGEQSVARSSGRSILAASKWSLVRPLNLDDSVPGKGALLLKTPAGPLWLIALSDGTGRMQVEPAHIVLEKFFSNKTDKFPVFINVDGTDLEYKKALTWKHSSEGSPLIWFGTGLGYPVSLVEMDCFGSFFQPDAGSVVVDGTVGALPPDIWWKRNIERVPVAAMPGWGALRCDYIIVRLDDQGKPRDFLQKTIRI